MGERSQGQDVQPAAAAYEAAISMHISHKLSVLTLKTVWVLYILLTLTFKCSAILLTKCKYGFHLVPERTRIEWSM